ncbi:hypothetical protein WJX73_000743 [Symbiochloris irregularis]|uniref:peptide-methionine (S)-S-oxide reductase n=1 Tax=Symbiochloris irregularis TaxID=706552 RepID=A0AAW1PZW9_9CHLO
MVPETTAERPLETATFGMGCFWCPDKKFCKVEGVVSTSVGYTGGNRPDPTYGSVCSGDGHTEAIKVTYDPKLVSYDELLKVFLAEHNPLHKGKTQYKSAIWTHSPEQEAAVKQALQSFEQTRGKKVATDVAPAAPWTDAESYHQKYSVSKTASTLQDPIPKKRFGYF